MSVYYVGCAPPGQKPFAWPWLFMDCQTAERMEADLHLRFPDWLLWTVFVWVPAGTVVESALPCLEHFPK